MGLHYKLRRAGRILEGLTPAEEAALDRICGRIDLAEQGLLSSADRLMAKCFDGCRGLCCRNAAFDDIIGLADLVYILHGAGALYAPLAAAMADAPPFFTADCPLLLAGRGPCMLPPALRPEVCITTFCADTAPVRRDIVRVRRAFMRLGWFLWWLGAKRLARRLAGG